MITVMPRLSSSSAIRPKVCAPGGVEHAELRHPDDDDRDVRVVGIGDHRRDALGDPEEHRSVQAQQGDLVVSRLRGAEEFLTDRATPMN